MFNKKAGLAAFLLLVVTVLVQLGLVCAAPQASAYIFGFPFPFVTLTVLGANQSLAFFAVLGQPVTSWALYPISLLVDLGGWFLLYFLAAAVLLPLLHRK